MLWLTLGVSALMTLFLVVGVFLLFRAMMKSQMEQIVRMTTEHREQRHSWEVERERLLNRCMTKEWESYAQMAGAMQASSSSDSPFPDGLSDETEERRWAEMHGTDGIGEVFAEVDARELGLLT